MKSEMQKSECRMQKEKLRRPVWAAGWWSCEWTFLRPGRARSGRGSVKLRPALSDHRNCPKNSAGRMGKEFTIGDWRLPI